MTFTIAPGLDLPIETITETFAILAKRGKGKTNTAVVMAEEIIGAGHPVVVLDPVGVWWGIRSAADGKGDGLPVIILGGEHADLPLKPEAGQLIAETVVSSRASFVIDVSAMSKTQARRFSTDFVETLYHRNREPLHVIVDEADMLAPQRARADGARLLGAMEDLVRRGRARGLGVTLITQRPASLNKDVLTQAEVLITLGMTGPRDVAAIDEWVRLHADEDEARAVKASLPTLDVGEAWIWSPGWLGILQKVQIRKRRTFDSSVTPKPGESRREVKRMTPVDIAALGERMEALAVEAKENDPRELRARAQRLARELAEAERVNEQLTRELTAARNQTVEAEVPTELYEILGGVTELSRRLEQILDGATKTPPRPREVAARVTPSPRIGAALPMASVRAPAATKTATEPVGAAGDLPKAQRAILTVLATYGPRPKSSVAVLAGYSAKGGGFNNPLGRLRTLGYINRGDPIEITPAGLDALGPVDPLPTGAELREHWKGQPALGKAHGLILDALAEHGELTHNELADVTGYSPQGGGFNNPLGRLRGLGLIHGGRDAIRLSEDLL